MADVETLARPESDTLVEDIEKLSWVEEVWGKGASKDIIDIDNVPEPNWLVEGIVVRQGLTLIYGESQVGKTTFCLYLIDALQTGSRFFGRKCQKAKVLLAEPDQSPPMLRAHKKKSGRPDKLGVIKGEIRWDNKDKVFFPYLEKKILDIYKPDVVIIDTYTSLGIEDINHPSASLSFDALRVFSQRYNCAFLLTHHTTKGGAQMGSNLNIAKMDSVIALEKKSKKKIEDILKETGGFLPIVAKQEKLKADSCEDIDLTFNTKTLQMIQPKSTKQHVKELKAMGKTVDEVAKLIELDRVDVTRETIKRYYREC